MYRQPEWRGFELTRRYEKFEAAFAHKPIRRAEDLPVVAYCPVYFSFGSSRPLSYFSDPAVMLKIQTEGALEHLRRVHDDFIPYFMPWYGTGCLASGFGCGYQMPATVGADPAVVSAAIQSPADIARLKIPDPERDGFMPTVLKTIEYAVAHGDLPVGLSDMNSPLSTAAQICGYDKLFYWMYDEPEAVHELMEKVCEGFARWTRAQKERIGEPMDASNGLQGLWAPKGLGVWVSDDDLVCMSSDLYAEFVAPHYSKLFAPFGGASVHYCGKGSHQIEAIAGIQHLKEVNNSPMGAFDQFRRLREAFQDKVVLGIQDIAPEDPETYYQGLFHTLDRLEGLVMVTWVIENIAMNSAGGSITLTREPFETANQITDAIRANAARVLARQQG